MKTKDPKTLQLFLDRSKEILHYAPLLHIYQSMEIVLRVMGRENDANVIYKRAKYLYSDWEEVWE